MSRPLRIHVLSVQDQSRSSTFYQLKDGLLLVINCDLSSISQRFRDISPSKIIRGLRQWDVKSWSWSLRAEVYGMEQLVPPPHQICDLGCAVSCLTWVWGENPAEVDWIVFWSPRNESGDSSFCGHSLHSWMVLANLTITKHDIYLGGSSIAGRLVSTPLTSTVQTLLTIIQLKYWIFNFITE